MGCRSSSSIAAKAPLTLFLLHLFRLAFGLSESCDVKEFQGASSTMTINCPYCDVKEGVFKSGQNWTDSRNPCLQYFCDHGKVVVSRTKCPESVSCQDDQPPYFIPGICCMQCGSQLNEGMATLTPWSDWTGCSKSCGTGRRSRSRSCTSESMQDLDYIAVDCQGDLHEMQSCNPQPCPGDQVSGT